MPKMPFRPGVLTTPLAALGLASGCFYSVSDLAGPDAGSSRGGSSASGGNLASGGEGGVATNGGGGAGAVTSGGSTGSGGSGQGGGSGGSASGGEPGSGGATGGGPGNGGASGGCASGQKKCGADCVSESDPAYGCAAASCSPCSTGNGTPGCTGGACAIVSCPATLGNCDGNLSNGCETNLTSSASHCGACGHDCLGGACESSKCMPFVLVSKQNDAALEAPWGIALDTSNVYFTVSNWGNGGRVMRVSKSGSGLMTLTSGQKEPFDIAVDSAAVYFTDIGGGQVVRVPTGGGSATALATGQTNPVGISVDGANAYWSTYASSGSVRSVPKAGGGGVQNLATGQGSPRGTVADPGTSGFVYFATAGNGLVKKVPKSGGSVTALTTGDDSPWNMTVDPSGQELFFTRFSPTGGGVRRVAKSASSTNSSVVVSASAPLYLAVDETHAYFTIHNPTGSVRRAPRDGGSSETLATGIDKPTGIAVDATAVYWVDYMGHKIWKLAK
jgi:sugar lactone lactonase YvrE